VLTDHRVISPAPGLFGHLNVHDVIDGRKPAQERTGDRTEQRDANQPDDDLSWHFSGFPQT
jgi:hypothetical protein